MSDDAEGTLTPQADGREEIDPSTPLAVLLTKSVWPIIALVDGEWQVPGTGFIVSRGGLMITARHVITGFTRYARKSRVADRMMHDGLYLAMCPGDMRLFCIDCMTSGETDDVVVCQLRAFDEQGPLDFAPLKLRPTPPAVGEQVLAFGYDEIEVTRAAGNERGLNLQARGHFACGPVLAVHWPRKEHGLGTFPCFDFGASVYGGMSGGPVIDERNFVCGVVSHSPSWERSATAAGLALLLGADLSLSEGPDGPARDTTLYEMLKDGTIEHDGSLDRVRIERSSDGECRVFLRNDWADSETAGGAPEVESPQGPGVRVEADKPAG